MKFEDLQARIAKGESPKIYLIDANSYTYFFTGYATNARVSERQPMVDLIPYVGLNLPNSQSSAGTTAGVFGHNEHTYGGSGRYTGLWVDENTTLTMSFPHHERRILTLLKRRGIPVNKSIEAYLEIAKDLPHELPVQEMAS
jgi:hypothetical protein